MPRVKPSPFVLLEWEVLIARGSDEAFVLKCSVHSAFLPKLANGYKCIPKSRRMSNVLDQKFVFEAARVESLDGQVTNGLNIVWVVVNANYLGGSSPDINEIFESAVDME